MPLASFAWPLPNPGTQLQVFGWFGQVQSAHLLKSVDPVAHADQPVPAGALNSSGKVWLWPAA